MPPLETSDLNQTAVLWAGPDAADEYDDYGEPKVGAAVEVACRWEERIDEVSGPNGTPVLSTVRAAVDRDVDVGARMWLGLLDDYVSTYTKLVVLAFSKIPDVRGNTFRRLVYLGRASVALPESS